MRDLQDRVAVVTGAASGIGRALSARLAGEGMHLALVDVDAAGLDATAETVRATGRNASVHTVDVSDKDAVFALPAAVVEAHGAVHLLANNAGVTATDTFEDQDIADFEWVIGINLMGVVYGTKAFMPQLMRADTAHVVNISSMFGIVGVPSQTAYCAAKYAVRGFSESLHEELRHTHIGVTVVHPGGINTNIMNAARAPQSAAESTAAIREFFATKTMPADTAAAQIVAAVKAEQLRCVITKEARMADWLKRLMPVAGNRMVIDNMVKMLGMGPELEKKIAEYKARRAELRRVTGAALRRLILGGAATLALVQVAAGVSVWAGIRAEVKLITEGQGDLFIEALQETRPAPGEDLEPGALQAIVDGHADQGLRRVVVVDPNGVVLGEAGEATAGQLEIDDLVPGRLVVVGDVVRQVLGPPGPPGAGEGPLVPPGAAEGPTARPPLLVVEFEPTLAQGLQQRATVALVVALGVGAVLMGAALWLTAVLRARDAAEAASMHQRHLARMGEMSAVLAHEIKNPLAALKGHAQLLAEALPPGKPADKAQRVVHETERLEQLTAALLDFARTGGVEPTDTLVASLLEDAAGAVLGDVEITCTAGTWPLDATRIRAVLVNLLDNAVQASGGPVSLDARVERGALVLRVRDQGPGILQADLDRVFEPFYTTRTQGTGLGLAQSRRIVELHGGTLRASNPPGGGALFTARIPESND